MERAQLAETCFSCFTTLSDAELDNLWRELAGCKLENGFIALPKGLQRLFFLVKTKLLVRECYIELVRIVEERSGVQLLGDSVSQDFGLEDIAYAVAGMSIEKDYIGEPSSQFFQCI